MGRLFRRVLLVAWGLASFLSPALLAQNPVAPTAPAVVGTPSLIPQDGIPDILTGPVTGGGGVVRLFSGAPDHALLAVGAPFGPFAGGVRVAMGDVNGDGTPDLITAQGVGGGLVRVFDGATAAPIAGGHPFGASFLGGVYVAAGDVDGDGYDDVVVAMGLGGRVQVYSLAGGITRIGDGFPYGALFPGGVRVATGDINGDGRADVITAPQTGGGGLVRIFNRVGPAVIADVAPYGAGFPGGIFVASGDVDGDGRDDLITSVSSIGGPIKVYSGADAHLIHDIPASFASGVSVAAADVTGDRHAEVIGGLGPGAAPLVGIFDGVTAGLLGVFRTDPSPTFTGGVFVASATTRGIRFTSAATTTFTTGTVGTFTITTSAVPTVTGITVSGTLPGGVTFTDNHDGTATLSGTPTPGVGGLHTLTFTATNGDDAPATQTFTLRVEGPPQITSANATTFSVNGAGSFTVTTIGFPRPTLTATGPLPTGVTFTDNGDGTAALAGTPQAGSGGTYPLTFTATNGVGTAATQPFTLTVDASPAFTSAAGATFIAGIAGSFAIAATAEPPITTITSSGVLPAGISFMDNGGGSATLSGPAAIGLGGSYPLTLTAANSVGPDATQAFTLTVHEQPVIISGSTTIFTLGSPGTFTVMSTGFPTATLSSTGTLPTGVAFVDNGDGTATLAGMPIAGTGGAYPLTITATNGVGAPVVQGFTLQVHEAAAITSANATSFNVGAASTFTVQTTGFPTPTITRGGVALPGGVAWIDNTDGTGTLSGIPDPGTGGTYAIAFQATNTAGSSPLQTFTLSVNAPPQITSADSTTFTAGNVSAFAVTTTGVPTATVSASGTLPAGITFNTGTETFEGTPTETGIFDTIQLTATNGVNPDATLPFTLTVVCPVIDVLPTTLPNGVFGVVYTGAVFTQTGGGAGTWSATGLPSGLTLDPNTGALAGTPTNTGVFNATVTFTGAANCQGAQSPTITIAPNAVGDSYSAGLGNTQIVAASHSAPSTPFFSFESSVLANDAGPAGTLVVTAVTSAPTTLGGQITIAATGAFTYTPQAGATGNDTYLYTVTSNGVSANATITMGLGTERVWYVNASAGAGNGTSSSPFNALTNVNNPGGSGDSDGPNDYIYLYPGSYAGGFETESGQTLWGASAVFNPVSGLSIGIGAKPTLTGTVTIASDNVTISSLAISTGSQTGIQNTGTRTGLTVKNGVTVTTTTAAAVMFNGVNSTDGGSPNFGINFQSVSANGAGNGIALTNLNTTSGSFTVTGTGAADSGGTIQSTIGAGILLTNVRNVSFSSYRLLSTGGSGVQGTGVTNFSFVNGLINGSGSSALTDSSNIAFNTAVSGTENNLQGTVTITGNSLLNAAYHGIDILNHNGTIANADLSTNTITSATSTAASQGSGIRLIAFGSASTVANVTRATIATNVITNFPAGAGILAHGGNANGAGSPGTMGVPGSATDIVSITGNRIAGQSPANKMNTHAIQAGVNGLGQGNFDISSNGTVANPITNIGGNVISYSSLGSATVTATITNNVIVANHTAGLGGALGISAGAGEATGAGDTATLTTTISGNQISQTDGNGILLGVREGHASVIAKILDNTVAAPLGGVRPGIRVDVGTTGINSIDNSMCLEISGNTSAGSGGSLGLGLRKQGTDPAVHSFGIEGLSPSPAGTPDVENHVSAANPAGSGTLLISATAGFTSCVVP